MAVLGVILLIVVAVVAVTVIGQGGDPVMLELPGFSIDTTAAGVFGVGAGSSALGLLGLVLLLGGVRRGTKRRKEVRQLRRDAGPQPGAGGEPGPAEEHRPGTGRNAPPPAPGESHPPRRRGGDDEGEHFRAVPRD